MNRVASGTKSAKIAFFLCLVCGIFGGHRFYLGRRHAVTMLVITLTFLLLCAVLYRYVYVMAWGMFGGGLYRCPILPGMMEFLGQLAVGVCIGMLGIFVVWVWSLADLFSVSRWTKEYNTALLAKIQPGQG